MSTVIDVAQAAEQALRAAGFHPSGTFGPGFLRDWDRNRTGDAPECARLFKATGHYKVQLFGEITELPKVLAAREMYKALEEAIKVVRDYTELIDDGGDTPSDEVARLNSTRVVIEMAIAKARGELT